MIESIGALWNSICRWFVENKDAITAFFMSGQAISFIAALVMLIKNLKGTKQNTASTETLNKTLENTNGLTESVTTLDHNFTLLKEENDGLRRDLEKTEQKLQASNCEITNKLNAILEVQSIVYSTIRDESVRGTVNTILNNARYHEKNFKAELEAQIEDLRHNYDEELKMMNDKVNKSIDSVKSTLNAGDVARANIEKKKKIEEITRY